MTVLYKSIGEYTTKELETALELCAYQRTIYALREDDSSLEIVHMLLKVIRAEMHRRSL